MNINANELLLLKKDLKLKEKSSEHTTVAPLNNQQANNTEAIMNSLMFKGANNVISNPQLAQKLLNNNNENEESSKKDNDAIPFQSNIAFEGRFSKAGKTALDKLRKYAMYATMALAVGATTAVATSCDTDKEIIVVPGSSDNNIEINIDLSTVNSMMEQMQKMWQQMLEQQKITNEQLQQNNEFMKQLLEMYKQNSIDDKAFQEKLFQFLMSSSANQEVIIDLLVQHGMKQDEANKILNDIKNEIASGNLSQAEAMNKILQLLGDIKQILANLANDFQAFHKDYQKDKQTEFKLLEEIVKDNKFQIGVSQDIAKIVKNMDKNLTGIENNTNTLLEIAKDDSKHKELIEAIKNIQAGGGSGSSSNIDYEKFAEMFKTMGMSLSEVIKMSSTELQNSIKDFQKNYIESEKNQNKVLQEISNKLDNIGNSEGGNDSGNGNTNLNGVISAINKLTEAINNGKTDVLDELNAINQALGKIEGSLDEIKQILSNLAKDFQAFHKDYQKDKQTEFKLLEEVIKDNKFQIGVTQDIAKVVKNMDKNLIGIENNTNLLLNIAQDDSKHKELIEAIKNIQAGGGSGSGSGSTNIDYARFEEMFKTMGMTLSDVIKMSSTELQNSIKDFQNTYIESEKNQNKVLQEISNKLDNIGNSEGGNGGGSGSTNLNGVISAINKLTEAVNNGKTDILEELNGINKALDNIEGSLDEIKQILSNLANDFQAFHKDYQKDKQTEFKLLEEIVKDNKFQIGVSQDIAKVVKNMDKNLIGIENNTNVLLEIAKDDSKHKELIEAIKNIQAGGGSGSGSTNIDYARFEEMFKTMGMTLTEVIKMSSTELQNSIKDFQNTYIESEKNQNKVLQEISNKLDNIGGFEGGSGDTNMNGVISAINKLTEAVNNGKTDILNELNGINQALDKIQTQLDNIFKQIGDLSAKVDTHFNKWDAQFQHALNLLDRFDTQLSTIINNQTKAEAYLNQMIKAVNELKVEIKNWQGSAGGSIDYDKLEQMWKEHDQANYEKYSELIKNLGINKNDLKTIEDLLTSIDTKISNFKDNSDILNKILAKLEGIDFTQPDYNAKLDKIIEILSNFKCNCENGGNNEGIVDDLDNILG